MMHKIAFVLCAVLLAGCESPSTYHSGSSKASERSVIVQAAIDSDIYDANCFIYVLYRDGTAARFIEPSADRCREMLANAIRLGK
jgi:hypothetical protein